MPTKINFNSFANLNNETSFINQLNENFTDLATFLDSVVNRDGTSPNTLTAALDVNSQNLNNVGYVYASKLYLGGTEVTVATAQPIALGEMPAGTVGAPGFAVNGDANTGLYQPAADNLAISVGGVQILNANGSGVSITGGLITSGTITAGALAVANLNLSGNLTVAGTVSLPAFTIATGSIATTASALDNSTKVATTAYVDSAVTAGKTVAGRVLQRVYAEFGETPIVAATPIDGTPPLVSEGTALASASITCASASNKIRVTFVSPYTGASVAYGNGWYATAHLHKDSDSAFAAARLGFGMVGGSTNYHYGTVSLCREITAGSTSAITISARAGTHTGTTTLATDDNYGSTCNKGTLILEEIAV